MGRKYLFSLRFLVITFFLRLQNTLVVSASQELPPFEIITKQSDSCGTLDIIPTDIRTFAPWNAAIYHRVAGNKWEFHTSGTIIGPGLIHSVQIGEPGRFPSDKNPRNFFIAVGINSTDLNSHDEFAQYSRVSLIQPFISEYNVYSHCVLYHLVTPLDVKNTPFVRDICFPFFASNSRFKNNLVDALRSSLRIEAIHFGFALSSKSDNTKNASKRKLKAWYIITLPEEQCATIFRYHYGKSSFQPVCEMRNIEKTRGFVPITRILEKLKVPASKDDDNDDDDSMCHGPGSGTMFNFGNNWFLGITVWLVPSMKKLACNSKTVYFGGVSKTEEVEVAARFLYNVFKCPPGKFSCNNPSKCINVEQTCDEKIDCGDGSDEDPIICDWKNRNSISLRNRALLPQGAKNFNATLFARNLTIKCPILKFTTEGVRCRNPETLEWLDCQSQFFSGREILVDCDDYHNAPRFTTQSTNLLCDSEGKWEGLESIVCQKKCGIHKPGSKGKEEYTRFPWDAAIFKNGAHICGGTLIQDNFILSHAQCIKDWIDFPSKRSEYLVFVRPVSSNYDENKGSEFSQGRRIKDIWISLNDLKDKYESGIALIKLKTPVLTNRKNAPMAVCSLIPPFSKVSPGKIGKISTEYQQEENNRNFEVVTEAECDSILGGRTIISKNEFCAASNSTKEKEGGILQGFGLNFLEESEEKSSYSLLGIASKIQDNRAVFLEVNSFSAWMIDILENNS